MAYILTNIIQAPNSGREFSIALNENQWLQISNKPVTREILMMTLAEVASISIRANINIDTTKVGIKSINYETATTNPAGNPLSTVEKCTCPEGYTG